MSSIIPTGRIENRILYLRGQKVILSADLAELYGVPAKALIQAVKRNRARFPNDFMFQLDWQEVRSARAYGFLRTPKAGRSRSQIVTLKRGRNVKHAPFAFTEQGVAMLSGVLRSRRAIEVNVQIMRAFVGLRRILASHTELSHRIDHVEKKFDGRFKQVFSAIRRMMLPRGRSRPLIGFTSGRHGAKGV